MKTNRNDYVRATQRLFVEQSFDKAVEHLFQSVEWDYDRGFRGGEARAKSIPIVAEMVRECHKAAGRMVYLLGRGYVEVEKLDLIAEVRRVRADMLKEQERVDEYVRTQMDANGNPKVES